MALDDHSHGLGALLGESLRGEHVLDLTGTDAECQGAERSVGRGVRVTANDGHTRLRDAQLSPMTCTMPCSRDRAEDGDAELFAVLLERLELAPGDGVLHWY